MLFNWALGLVSGLAFMGGVGAFKHKIPLRFCIIFLLIALGVGLAVYGQGFYQPEAAETRQGACLQGAACPDAINWVNFGVRSAFLAVFVTIAALLGYGVAATVAAAARLGCWAAVAAVRFRRWTVARVARFGRWIAAVGSTARISKGKKIFLAIVVGAAVGFLSMLPAFTPMWMLPALAQFIVITAQIGLKFALLIVVVRRLALWATAVRSQTTRQGPKAERAKTNAANKTVNPWSHTETTTKRTQEEGDKQAEREESTEHDEAQRAARQAASEQFAAEAAAKRAREESKRRASAAAAATKRAQEESEKRTLAAEAAAKHAQEESEKRALAAEAAAKRAQEESERRALTAEAIAERHRKQNERRAATAEAAAKRIREKSEKRALAAEAAEKRAQEASERRAAREESAKHKAARRAAQAEIWERYGRACAQKTRSWQSEALTWSTIFAEIICHLQGRTPTPHEAKRFYVCTTGEGAKGVVFANRCWALTTTKIEYDDISATARRHINDISPLAGLAQLQTLDLRLTQVKDLAPLRRLETLHWLQTPNGESYGGLSNTPENYAEVACAVHTWRLQPHPEEQATPAPQDEVSKQPLQAFSG